MKRVIFKLPLSRNILQALCLAILLVLLPVVPAKAKVTGWAQWSYLDYRATGGGLEDQEANHFTQDYALYYHSKGLFGGGRLGSYDVGLGYEWAAFDTEIDDEEIKTSTGKVLYRGSLLIAPGGLPFRLEAYSYDNFSVTFLPDRLESSVLEPSVVTDILNGQRVTTGINFIAGIRNGTYLGQYRELLSKYPRIFVDYREDYVRDLESREPEHSRLRNLAFVSLNKKDNWFHYRYREYTDYEDSVNDFSEKTYMLGTVDHLLRRQWINLTNWIEMSVDGSLTIRKDNEFASGEGQTYQLNFANILRRDRFRVQNYNYFMRERDELNLHKIYELPIYADGILDVDRRWNAAYIAYGEDELLSGLNRQEKGNYLMGRLSLNERDRIQYAPMLELEVREGDEGEGHAARAGLEIHTNSKFRPEVDWLARYRATWLSGSTSTDFDADYLEQEVLGEASRRLASNWRVGGRQRFIYGTGELDDGVMRYIAPQGNQELAGTYSKRSRIEGSVFRTTTEVYGEVQNSAALSNRLSLVYDMVRKEDGGSIDQLILEHTLRYQKATLKINVLNQFGTGDEPPASRLPTNLGSAPRSAAGVGKLDYVFTHQTRVDYAPLRSFRLIAAFALDWQSGEAGESLRWYVNQDARYTFFTVNGFTRKLAEIYQTYEHESFYGEDGDASELEFTLGGNYYLTRALRFGAKTAYRYYDPIGISELELRALVGVDYEKLQCELHYSYGLAQADGLPDDRTEHLFEARVKKIF